MTQQRQQGTLKTPHYHCNVNSTRVIWMQVKGYVDRHNISFQLEEIRSLLQTAAENIMTKDGKTVYIM